MYMHWTDRSWRDTYFPQYDYVQIFLSPYHSDFLIVGMPVASMGVSGQMMVNKPRMGSFVQSGPAPPPTAAQGWVFLLSFLRFPIISLSHEIILLNDFFLFSSMAMPHGSKLKYTQMFNSNDRHKRGHLTGQGIPTPIPPKTKMNWYSTTCMMHVCAC